MGTRDILKEIKKLPVSKRMLIVEKTLKAIRESDTKRKMVKASEKLLKDYKSDGDLTAFTLLDYQEFYETR
ncbi:MAG: hypothetical protein A2W91_08765 [Bacteroidetes bacterium GWF2_38_335]|nr:MAG: hypothetical protein A2W91_08765 [Bacteroidetes bacterium GWF2_38_335]OFY80466.1 MAG: hypothetical protein A2281_08490 [Bacteroidetes bacterium RIFOXYA12_FULL_38_20]HBS85928.1 hypothetical protein [Bacteroidales bacterium]